MCVDQCLNVDKIFNISFFKCFQSYFKQLKKHCVKQCISEVSIKEKMHYVSDLIFLSV